MFEPEVDQYDAELRWLDRHDEFVEAVDGMIESIAGLSEQLSQDSLAALQLARVLPIDGDFVEHWPLTSVNENTYEFTEQVISRLKGFADTSVPSPIWIKSLSTAVLGRHYPEQAAPGLVGELVGWSDAMAERGWPLQVKIVLNSMVGATVNVYQDNETTREYLLAKSISERLTSQNGGVAANTSLQISSRVTVSGHPQVIDSLRPSATEVTPNHDAEPADELEPTPPPVAVRQFVAAFTASQRADNREQASLLQDLPERAWEVLEAYEALPGATDQLNQLARQVAANAYIHDVVKHRGSVDKKLLEKAGVDLEATLQAFIDATIDSFAANGQRTREEIAASLAGKYKTFSDLQILPNLWGQLVVLPINELRAKL